MEKDVVVVQSITIQSHGHKSAAENRKLTKTPVFPLKTPTPISPGAKLMNTGTEAAVERFPTVRYWRKTTTR